MGRKLLVLLMICLTVESFTPESIYAGLFCHRLRRRRCGCEEHEDLRAITLTCRISLIATYNFGGTCAYKMYQLKTCPDGPMSGVTTNCDSWPIGDCSTGTTGCFQRFAAPTHVPKPGAPKPTKPEKGQRHEDSAILESGIGQWIDGVTPGTGTIEATKYQVHLPGNRWAVLIWSSPTSDPNDDIGSGYEVQAKLSGVQEVPASDFNFAHIHGTAPGTAPSFTINAYLSGPDVNRHYVVRMK